MAFSASARVKVTDQSSDYRGQLGTVISVDDDNHQVRMDGLGVGRTILLTTSQLSTTTIASPITY